VRQFFFEHYLPNNAILVVAGNVKHDQVKQLSEKWFGPIPAGKKVTRKLPLEPIQERKRTMTVEANVPANALYKAWHMGGRFENDFYACDLLSDVLSRGHSSRFYQKLVNEKKIFSSVSSFTMGTIDPGLLVASGRVNPGISLADAEGELNEVIHEVLKDGVQSSELEKVKNQAEATLEFGEVEVMNRAMNLAFAALSGNPELVNLEAKHIEAVEESDLYEGAHEILREENSSVLYYQSIKK
jgi:zinc protease